MKEKVLQAMREFGAPVNAGKIAEITGIDRKEVDKAFAELLIVGGLLITGSGLSLLNLKDCKTLNLLPALLVPVVWFLIRSVI